MALTAQDFPHIPGWGIDADPKNDPTYPMRDRSKDDHTGASGGVRPTLQVPDLEVLKSIERPTPSAVIGDSVEPMGLSGMIRRFAFQFSENQYPHWLPLVMADKINVVEGIIDDLLHGKVPNIYAEKGYGASWKHDRQGQLVKLAVGVVAVAGVVALLASSGKGEKKRKKKRDRQQPKESYDQSYGDRSYEMEF